MNKPFWIDEIQGVRWPVLAGLLSTGFGIIAYMISFMSGVKNDCGLIIALFVNSLILTMCTGSFCKKFVSGAAYMGTIISINVAFSLLEAGIFRWAIACFIFCVIQIIFYACVVGKPLRFDNSNDIFGVILWFIQVLPFTLIYWHFVFTFIFLALSITAIILLIGEAKFRLWLKENAPVETEMEEKKYIISEGAYRSSEIRAFVTRPQSQHFFFRLHRWLYQKYVVRSFT